MAVAEEEEEEAESLFLDSVASADSLALSSDVFESPFAESLSSDSDTWTGRLLGPGEGNLLTHD